MARQKSKKLQDMSVYIKTALESSPDIKGTDFTVEDGGVVNFKDPDTGNLCRVKFAMVTGPRKNKSSVIDNMIG
ncbi:MAG: hypothetical protein M0R17_04060 [Candidatus Omnitrophica bacterium]|jgi:hypothetical protein|nr:hypothetical protein [Candidatus Omnitrophota bacterium]